ncbi:MAG: hypothetical protein J0L94_06845 [Rhodothermia bacterium]|nr:hypothetical protein [Rhodothermia bacterium]
MQPLTYEQVLALFAETREQLRLSSLEAEKRNAEADREKSELREQLRLSSETIR